MERRLRVVVYGNSLNMAGIATSLKADASLDVVCVNPFDSTARSQLSELNPGVIAFDLSNTPPGLDISLLRDQPGMLLIGVDPSSDDLLVLSSQSTRALSVADLLQVIHNEESKAA